MSERNEVTTNEKVPALVVSGFLGSGKTTLIHSLLDQAVASGIRIALISNEIGELGVDRALLGEGGKAYVELEGGCVCCELADDLVDTLQALRDEINPDRIVVETSGAALPFDTQLNFWRDPVREWVGDDMAVVVVNAEQIVEGRDLEGTFTDQITSADLLVLNKVDLVTQDELKQARENLRALEPEAPIVTSTRGEVAPELLFPPSANEINRSGPAPSSPPHHHEHFETEILDVTPGTPLSEIESTLQRSDLLRAKGFIESDEGPRLIQLVGRRIEFQTVSEIPAPELANRVVMIRRASSS
ncbi:MAG: GTP-binding protein [Myxococcota bacterium]|nr:GTP-binding protein [Myxococcota bacterium]